MTVKLLPDRVSQTGTLLHQTSATIVYTAPTNGIFWLVGHAFMLPSAGGVAKAAHFFAEAVIVSDGTLAGTRLPTALTGSANPQPSLGLAAAHAEVSEYNTYVSQLYWQVDVTSAAADLILYNGDTVTDATYLMWAEIYEWIP